MRSEETSTLLLQLFERYRLEGTTMPDLLEEFARETIEELLRKMPVKERLKGLSPDDLRAALPAEERLKGLSPDELLAALPAETREALARRLKDLGSPADSQ